MNRAIYCPFCRASLLDPFRFEGNVAWCPSVYICNTCNIRLLSWVIYSSQIGNRKSVLPLNWFQFYHLIDDLEKSVHNYKSEAPLVITEDEYQSYKDFYRGDGLDLVQKIYEHKEKIRSRSYN